MESDSVSFTTYTANILTVLSTAFGSVTFPTVIWLHILQPNIALSLKLYSSKSVTVMCTTNGCTKYSVWQCYVPHCNLAVNICSVHTYYTCVFSMNLLKATHKHTAFILAHVHASTLVLNPHTSQNA